MTLDFLIHVEIEEGAGIDTRASSINSDHNIQYLLHRNIYQCHWIHDAVAAEKPISKRLANFLSHTITSAGIEAQLIGCNRITQSATATYKLFVVRQGRYCRAQPLKEWPPGLRFQAQRNP